MQTSLHLVIIGGFAGSGKTELAKLIARGTRWPLLDKDTLTRPLVEALAELVCGDMDDRHTQEYFTGVRPLEYQSLMSTAEEIIEHGCSVVVAAPFIRELSDSAFIEGLWDLQARYSVNLHVVWVDCDADTMFDRLAARGASRDRWKLAAWEDYLDTIDLSARPGLPYTVISNGCDSAATMGEEAVRLIEAWSTEVGIAQ